MTNFITDQGTFDVPEQERLISLGAVGNSTIAISAASDFCKDTLRVTLTANYARNVPHGFDSNRSPPGGAAGAIWPPQRGVIGSGVTVILPSPEASVLLANGFATPA